MGRNKPQRNIIGKRKKLEKVWASNTSLTDTEMKRPRKVEVTAMNSMLKKAAGQFIPDKSIRKEANITGTSAFSTPKIIAPVVLASIRRFRLMGASSSLSKERLFRSKVMVTASMEVVPNNTDKDITPGKISLIFTALSDLKKNIRVQAKGNISPQLILGGFR